MIYATAGGSKTRFLRTPARGERTFWYVRTAESWRQQSVRVGINDFVPQIIDRWSVASKFY
jgi:hypothetical protein